MTPSYEMVWLTAYVAVIRATGPEYFNTDMAEQVSDRVLSAYKARFPESKGNG